MVASVRIEVSDTLYLRDPQDTELGRKLISASILLIDKLGIEQFTFKKLAKDIGSTEASMYRYFESKHMLLTYLLSWYWSWLDYKIDYLTHNVDDPRKRLQLAMQVLTDSVKDDPATTHIDEEALFRIMIVESAKAYFTKQVNPKDREALFVGYGALNKKIADIIRGYRPKYRYPKALVNTMVLVVQRQSFFAEHVPAVTELRVRSGNMREIAKYLEHLVFAVLD